MYSVEELNQLREELADRRLIGKLNDIGITPTFENPFDFLKKDKEDYEVLIVTQRGTETLRVTVHDSDDNRSSLYIASPVILNKIEDEAISIDLDGYTVAKVTDHYAVIEFIAATTPTTYMVDNLYGAIINAIKNVKEVGVAKAKRDIAKNNLKNKLEEGLKTEIKDIKERYEITVERQKALMQQLTETVQKRDTYSMKLKLLEDKQNVSVDKLLKDLDETDILESYEITDMGYKFNFVYTDITDLEGNKYKGTKYTVIVSNSGNIKFECPEEDKVHCYWGDSPTCHPHISGNGSACFGEIGSSISIAIAEADLISAVYMLYAYLGSANETDMAGEYITRWELVELSPAAKQRKEDYHAKVKEIAQRIADEYESDEAYEIEQYILENVSVLPLYKINRYPAADEVENYLDDIYDGIEEIVGCEDDSNQEEDDEELRCANCHHELESYAYAMSEGVVDGDNLFCSIACYTEWEEM